MTETKLVPVAEIRENPGNPRLIKDEAFARLCRSVREFPQMLRLRPVVVNPEGVILGGNMRYRAAVELGMREIPVTVAVGLTPQQEREFIIKDNVSGGEWDFDALANEWDVEQLAGWGLDVPGFEPAPEELTSVPEAKPPTMRITFSSPEQLQKAEADVQELIDRKFPGAYYSVSAGGL